MMQVKNLEKAFPCNKVRFFDFFNKNLHKPQYHKIHSLILIKHKIIYIVLKYYCMNPLTLVYLYKVITSISI